MTTPSQELPPTADTLAMEQAYQDNLIVKRLPRWIRRLRIVSPTEQNIPANGLYESQHAALRGALKDSLACRQWLEKELARIEGIDRFVKLLLQHAMQGEFGTRENVDGLYFRRWYTYTAPSQGSVWGRYPVVEKDYFDVPLIEAALDNFTPGEGRNEQHKDNCIVDSLSQRPRRQPRLPSRACAASWTWASAINSTWTPCSKRRTARPAAGAAWRRRLPSCTARSC